MERLWAPWRLEYVSAADEAEGCFLCGAGEMGDEEALVVRRGLEAVVVLNRFPYSSGHLLVAPRRHEGDFSAVGAETVLEIHRLASDGMRALDAAYRPEGYNLGWNLGRVAGAGLPGHVHLHVVPRWAGDTSFMPVLADVKVLPEHLLATRQKLAQAWPR